jgi:hypothetical protein
MNMIRALRWLLVAPMAALGWISAFTAALATHSLIDTYCPEQYKVSNSCNWEWAILASGVSGGLIGCYMGIFANGRPVRFHWRVRWWCISPGDHAEMACTPQQ